MWLLKKAYPQGRSQNQFINWEWQGSLSHALYPRIISPKRISATNTCSNDFLCTYIEHVTSHKNTLGVAVRGDGGVGGKSRVVGIPKFHS